MPEVEEVVRLVAWLGVTVLYVALWLAFGLLLSVVIRRAATSALVGFGVWLFVAIPFIGPLLVALAREASCAGPRHAATRTTARSRCSSACCRASSTPKRRRRCSIRRSRRVSDTCRQVYSPQQLEQIPTLLPFDQSFLLILPHIVVLLALTIGCFALAYAQFMRQEVRA